MLDFCKEATAHAPDLPPPGAEETAPKVKRRRTTTTQSAEGAPAPKRQPKKSKKAIEMDAGESEMDEGDIPVAVLELVAGGGGTGAAGGEDAGPSGDGVADAQFDAAVFDAAPGREAEEEDYDE